MHPGGSGQYSTVRWTSPIDGNLLLSVLFKGVVSFTGSNGTTTDVHVLKNGVSIFDGNIQGFFGSVSSNYSDKFGNSPSAAFSTAIQVAKSDKIDFCVGDGGNGYAWDATGISANIKQLPPFTTVGKLSDIKKINDGSYVRFSGAVVTGKFNGFYYVEDMQRACGIKIIDSTSFAIDDILDVIGSISTVNGEKVITSIASQKMSTGHVCSAWCIWTCIYQKQWTF